MRDFKIYTDKENWEFIDSIREIPNEKDIKRGLEIINKKLKENKDDKVQVSK